MNSYIIFGTMSQDSEVGETCSTHENGEVFLKRSWSKNLKGRNRLEDPVVNSRILLKWLLEESGGSL